MPTDKLVKTHFILNRSMFCENCGTPTVSVKTTIRIYASGKEAQIEECDNCGRTQEIEHFSGPSTRIKTKND